MGSESIFLVNRIPGESAPTPLIQGTILALEFMIELTKWISLFDGIAFPSPVEGHLIGQIGIVKCVVYGAEGLGQLRDSKL